MAGFEPTIRLLQSLALPLGHIAERLDTILPFRFRRKTKTEARHNLLNL